MKSSASSAALICVCFLFVTSLQAQAPFREFPAGEPVVKNKMKIAAVWLPPIQMEGMKLPNQERVIHLECDVHAVRGNKNGFGVGEWIPYLTVKYSLVHTASKKKIEGKMMPMVAKDGPHYAATIILPANGKYHLTYELRPPTENGFGRHSDPITGVAPFWKPFSVEYNFDYQGIPKD